jgi:hypothetical protein
VVVAVGKVNAGCAQLLLTCPQQALVELPSAGPRSINGSLQSRHSEHLSLQLQQIFALFLLHVPDRCGIVRLNMHLVWYVHAVPQWPRRHKDINPANVNNGVVALMSVNPEGISE